MIKTSSGVSASGRLPSVRKRLMALPPKMSPAPVVSTTWMPLGDSTVTAPFLLAAWQPFGPSVA